MAFDPMHRLFVANADGTVQVFSPPVTSNATPSFTLRGSGLPYIAIDASGAAYILTVVSCGNRCSSPAIEAFAAPVTATSTANLLFTMHPNVSNRGLAFDAKDNIWTASVFTTILGISCSIQNFSPPFGTTTTAAQTIDLGTCDGDPFGVGIAFDAAGDLFVNDSGGNVDMFSISPSGTFSDNRTPIGNLQAYGVALDKENNLYVTTRAGTLVEFSPPYTAMSSPVLTLGLPGTPVNPGLAIGP